MARATPQSLTATEQALLAETTRDALRQLDEDALGDLLARVRRARNKFVDVHRREVAAQIAVKGGRGMASAPPRRSASKAEVFEAALARTSGALATAARHSAKQLRDDRLAASRSDASPAVAPSSRRAAPSASTTDREPPAPRRSRARQASTQAIGARRQAKRDARR